VWKQAVPTAEKLALRYIENRDNPGFLRTLSCGTARQPATHPITSLRE